MMTSQELGEEFLEHFGVKGMKWGVRRSKEQLQKAAGTYKSNRDPSTPEGKARATRKSAAASRRTISDGDLDNLIDRLKKEKQLKSLVEEDLTPGRVATKAIMSQSGKKVAGLVVVGAGAFAAKKAVDKAFGSEAAGFIRLPKK